MFRTIKPLFIVFLILGALLNMTLSPNMHIGKAKPDFYLVIFLMIILRNSNINKYLLAAVAGAIKDVFSSHWFGIEIFAMIILSFIVDLLFKKMTKDSGIIRLLIFTFFCLLYYSILYILMSTGTSIPFSLSSLLQYVLGISTYTACVCWIIESIMIAILPKKNKQFELFEL